MHTRLYLLLPFQEHLFHYFARSPPSWIFLPLHWSIYISPLFIPFCPPATTYSSNPTSGIILKIVMDISVSIPRHFLCGVSVGRSSLVHSCVSCSMSCLHSFNNFWHTNSILLYLLLRMKVSCYFSIPLGDFQCSIYH